ncbi:MAG: DUF3800 domain-containing protein [Actinomycetales bacterium]|uniref:DUF3800 domain-containing protein n=1 Tax=uncultured Salinibacterium sp. TaxID=459274 RepID=UPI0030DB8E0F|tara:strand:- start:97 stop:957 length:861 start_codon:yes stop_codon:yes gene_type:complete
MLLFYADEYGDHSMRTVSDTLPLELKSGTSEFFVLTGVGVRDTSRKPIADALFRLKTKHFGKAAAKDWDASEIKGRYLMRASRSAASGNVLESPTAYGTLDTPWKVNALIKDLGLIFATFRPLVFAVAIDKRAMLNNDKDLHPLGVAYAYLHQRIAAAMEDLYAGDASIIVADQQTQHEAFFRSGQMHEIRRQLTVGLPRKPVYELVMDKPLWVDTDLSSWDREIIQLADIVAYSAAECMKQGKAPTEPWFLWKEIERCMAVHWQSGKVMGSGLAIFPKQARAPKM